MIGLVDCNNFYCSCERVFRPELEGKPVIVLSNNDGCAISISDEAKALGIKMAVPVHTVDNVIRKNNVTVFSSNYTLYGDMSKRVIATIGGFAPRMEVYSIDETFLDFENVPEEQLRTIGERIKTTVKQYTGIPVTIGIAPTKTLAKMANRFAKKTKKKIGVHLMQTADEINEVLKFTEIGDVWGIGTQHAKLLFQIGVRNAYDFTLLPDEWVRQKMSVVGLRMLHEMRGTPCKEWEVIREKRKAIRTSRSFGQLISNKDDLAEAISNFAANCGLKLRTDHTCAGKLEVYIQTNPFRYEDKQYYRSIVMQLPVASNNNGELIRQALKGLDMIYSEGYNFQKAGVVVTEIVPAHEVQHGLFDELNRRRAEKVMSAFDVINNTFGKNKLRMAAQGYEKRWRLKAGKLSPCYTTDISQLPKVNCHV